MARGNPGYLLKITQGVHESKMAIAYHKEQTPEFKEKKRLFVHLLGHDFKPILRGNEHHTCLVQDSFCHVIGMSD